jgi:hypothetical protein
MKTLSISLNHYQKHTQQRNFCKKTIRGTSSRLILTRFGHQEHDSTPSLGQSAWRNRYAAVLATGLVAMTASVMGTTVMTPYTAPLFVALETGHRSSETKADSSPPVSSQSQSLADDSHPTDSPKEQVAERLDHMYLERDFALQEEGSGTLLGLALVGLSHMIASIKRKLQKNHS